MPVHKMKNTRKRGTKAGKKRTYRGGVLVVPHPNQDEHRAEDAADRDEQGNEKHQAAALLQNETSNCVSDGVTISGTHVRTWH